MSFHIAKIKSILAFCFVCALLLVNCTDQPKTVEEKLVGKWEMKMLGGEKLPEDREVTFTCTENKSCTYEFFEDGEFVKKKVCYYLLLNNETVFATYYDELCVEMQEQFDIVKLNAKELVLEERKSNGKTVTLARSGE